MLHKSLPEESAPVDLASLMARVENDWELLNELIALFLDSSPLLLAEIEAAVARGDAQAIERASHALRGSMQNLGAVPAARAASALEDVGRSGDLARADQSLACLHQEFERLVSALPERSTGGHS